AATRWYMLLSLRLSLEDDITRYAVCKIGLSNWKDLFFCSFSPLFPLFSSKFVILYKTISHLPQRSLPQRPVFCLFCSYFLISILNYIFSLHIFYKILK